MGIWNDLGYSIRSFARTPLSTVALVLTIGLGVGGNAAVDGFIRGLATVTPANEMTPEMASGLARISTLLRAVATAVFAIACANVASLLLSRASARSRETSVRVALGASRAQLTRQLLADSMLVTVVGAAVGALLTAWTMMLVPVLFVAEDAEQLIFAPDPARLLVIIAIGMLLTMASGALPMFELRHEPSRVLQRENADSSPRMRVLRTSLVVVQLALCCVLIVSMAVLALGLDAALHTRVTHRLGTPILVTTQARLFDSPSETTDVGLEYFQRIERAARATGHAFDAVWVSRPPGSWPSLQSARIEPPNLPTREVTLEAVALTPQLLRGITLPLCVDECLGAGTSSAAPAPWSTSRLLMCCSMETPSVGGSRIPQDSTSRSSALCRRCQRTPALSPLQRSSSTPSRMRLRSSRPGARCSAFRCCPTPRTSRSKQTLYR
jgi:hypothetical protein